MMVILLPVSLLVSRKLPFDNFLCTSFSDLYKALNIGFRIFFLEEIFLRDFPASQPILTPTVSPQLVRIVSLQREILSSG